ncbi:hypothetical protein KCU73_g11817, partial [Aureobasidium melanogenum]
MATAPLCNTTLDGTTPELSQEYLHETELLVTDLLWTWNPAGPAWNRPRICVQDLVKFHTHLMRFPQHDYQFNETQILSRNSTDHVQESGWEVEDRDEKKFNELFAKAGDHAARIDALENKVSRLLSNASTPLAETSILGREENEQESLGKSGGDSETSSVGMFTPDSTVRSSSPVPTPRPRRPILTLSVKGHNTNMLVKIGLNAPFRSLRQNLSRSRWGLVELWHGNAQIMDTDTPKILGLE